MGNAVNVQAQRPRARRPVVPGGWKVLVAALVATACGQAAAKSHAMTVYTVNYPLAYFAQRIGGDAVRVEFPAPADGDPAYWEPGADDIAAYKGADLILLNGAGYAKWTKEAGLPADKLVDTSAAVADRLIAEDDEGDKHTHADGTTHSHGDDGGHHSDMAFTTWLDPQLAIAQAAAIRDALSARQPESAAAFQAGFASLEADLKALDGEFEAVFAKLGDTPVVFSHPVYQYLQRRYEVNGISVHWEPDQRVTDDQLTKLGDRMITHPAEMMIWEGEPLPRSLELMDAWAVKNVVVDPCGNRPEEGDYLSVMQANIGNLQAALAD